MTSYTITTQGGSTSATADSPGEAVESVHVAPIPGGDLDLATHPVIATKVGSLGFISFLYSSTKYTRYVDGSLVDAYWARNQWPSNFLITHGSDNLTDHNGNLLVT